MDVRTGYGEWVATYEDTVEDAMDIALLDELEAPDWHSVGRAADLGCGTGRTAAWLRRNGVASIDGVDLSPEMLAVARERGVHDRLVEAEVADTRLDAGAYDLVVASLVDEHLEELAPLYREARRLGEPGALFVLVAFHPHFIIASGMPTHFTSRSGEPIAIATLDRVEAEVGALPAPPGVGGLRVGSQVAIAPRRRALWRSGLRGPVRGWVGVRSGRGQVSTGRPGPTQGLKDSGAQGPPNASHDQPVRSRRAST